jgi:hypothetical protein
MKTILSVLALLLVCCNLQAQNNYTISGTVSSASGKSIQSATVFIAGSQKVTMTNADGQFTFKALGSGNYQLVVTMLGYASVKTLVIINNQSETVDIALGEKKIALQEVIVGGVKPKKVLELEKTNLKIFVKKFLGETGNARHCKILNPEILEFSTSTGVLKAATYDFLEIENANLGYHIKYLLRSFEYEERRNITYYDGECIFEDIEGSPKQKEEWIANRKKAYEGSLLHFLRSVYNNTSRQEGFVVYLTHGEKFPLGIGPNAVVAEQVIKRIDQNFITFNPLERFYIAYDKGNTKYDRIMKEPMWTMADMPYNASLFMVNTQIDRRGNFADYGGLSVQGAWVKNRLGEQLPLEYLPQ